MNMLKIALLQMTPCKSLKENLEKGIMCCKQAKEKGADIALFPEMWSNGYNIYNRPVEEWKKEAISIDSDFINILAHLQSSFIWLSELPCLKNIKKLLVIHLPFLIGMES